MLFEGRRKKKFADKKAATNQGGNALKIGLLHQPDGRYQVTDMKLYQTPPKDIKVNKLFWVMRSFNLHKMVRGRILRFIGF